MIYHRYKGSCFLCKEDNHGKCGRCWDSYVYIYIHIYIYIYIHTYLSRIYVHIDDVGYMTNPMDLCWFMKLVTHVAIKGMYCSEEMCQQQEDGCDMSTKKN